MTAQHNNSDNAAKRLAELERIYRQAADEQPSARLDQTVLGYARRQHAEQSPAKRFNWLPIRRLPIRSWSYGATAFASLALAALLVVNLADQQQPPGVPADFESVTPAAPERSSVTQSESYSEISTQPEEASSGSAGESASGITAAPEQESDRRQDRDRAETTRPDAGFPAEAPRKPLSSEPEPEPALLQRSTADSQQRIIPSRQRQSGSRQTQAQTNAAASNSTLELRESDDSTAAASRQEEAEQKLQVQPAPPPIASDAVIAPEQWLEIIREKIQAGDLQTAQQELALFKETYPEQDIPADLLENLEGSGQ